MTHSPESMSPEPPTRETAEAAVLKRFDTDLSMIEELADPLDRGRYALDLFHEAVGDQSQALYGKAYRGEPIDPPQGWGQHYQLPDHGNTVKPYAGTATWGARTTEHTFVPVNQHSLWRVDQAAQPYLYAGMSECSLLVGKTGSDLWVAHVGYSKAEWVDAAYQTMIDAGVTPEHMAVVASTGPHQEQQSQRYSSFGPRAQLADYHRLGIPESQILEFQFRPGQAGEPSNINMAKVLVNNRELYVKQADYDNRVSQMGPDKAEQVLAL